MILKTGSSWKVFFSKCKRTKSRSAMFEGSVASSKVRCMTIQSEVAEDLEEDDERMSPYCEAARDDETKIYEYKRRYRSAEDGTIGNE
ncbi:hypothetical protein J6590_070320 [Homalodisca vitripennis]|nr:hypothetical protein J6590_070320 [Homalodisca vitripennis]